MFSLATWNIRGLNRTPKQSEVRQVVSENQLSMCAILESHVDISALSKVCSKVFRYWEWTLNANLCDKGCRIILGWNIDVVDMVVISQSNQAMHVKVVHKVTRGLPWVLMGDFNVALNLEDYHSGPSTMNASMVEFKDCVSNIKVMDTSSSGIHYTWNQKPKGGSGVLKKLDRVMGNVEFIDAFQGAYAIFQPYRISDHSLAVLKIPGLTVNWPKPFKFFNFITSKGKFMEEVSNYWNSQVDGHNMFKVVSKLKRLKKPLRKLVYDHEEEAIYLHSFNEAKLDEERFLKQKAKIEWLEGLNVVEAFVAHYDCFLGSSMECIELDIEELFHSKVSGMVNTHMTRPITNAEIKTAMFDIGDDKAPGPNGYTSAFFKKAWDIVGMEYSRAHNYHRNRGPPRCAFKVDIQKAYDTVDWRFLENILYGFGFHPTMIKWIMACVTSTSFSISLNGNVHGYFKGKRGLRQGDPLSPYLFTLVMEVLTLILKRRVNRSDSFRYHRYCEDLQIINVCFADDLFLFARGDVESAKVIMDSLDEFKATSGFVPSIPKSTAFFCNVLRHVKTAILTIMPFAEGELPVPWIHSYKLRGRSFWAIPLNGADMSWGWRKLLQLRDLVRPHIWTNIGNGALASAWYDYWDPICPLIRWLSPREISNAGFHLQSHVADCISNNSWSWPQVWLQKTPNLGLLAAPNIDPNSCDTYCWRESNGNMNAFSVKRAWKAFRPRGNEVEWYRIVWFSHCIPRHAFYIWLVMCNSLRTQDKLGGWDSSGNGLNCPLCGNQPDSHSYLFFECSFSSQVWMAIRSLADMDNIPLVLHDIIIHLQPLA
ncbi:RNA-directed DNA polymerase, eukaryota, reverse transcriptase zinc-binding domain protein [Tanacetum coccineum]